MHASMHVRCAKPCSWPTPNTERQLLCMPHALCVSCLVIIIVSQMHTCHMHALHRLPARPDDLMPDHIHSTFLFLYIYIYIYSYIYIYKLSIACARHPASANPCLCRPQPYTQQHASRKHYTEILNDHAECRVRSVVVPFGHV